MALDAFVRCRCIQDGLAKPHPFPDRLALDETMQPYLTGDPTEEEMDLHDDWFAESCEHGGYLVSEPLGNITRIAHLRKLIEGLERHPGLRFPVLQEEVIYDGTHTGDHLPSNQARQLLKEVEIVLQSRDLLTASEQEFFDSLVCLAKASIETKNPILF